MGILQVIYGLIRKTTIQITYNFFFLLRNSSPKNEHSVINYSLSRSSSGQKLRYLLWNQRAFWPCIGTNATTMFKAQKFGRDIVKIVHVTAVIFMKLREYFLSVLRVSLRRAFTPVWRSSQMRCALLASRGMHTHSPWYSRERTSKTDTEEEKLLNKLVIFVFFLCTKSILVAS